MSNEAMLEAIQSGNTDGVIALLENGMDVNFELFELNDDYDDFEDRKEKTTALVVAAENNKTDIVEILLDAGANINGRNMVEQTACHIAAERGHLEPLQVLIARGANIMIPDCESHPPLYATVWPSTNNECAVALVKAGARLNDTITVCHVAGMSCDAIQALIDRGVNLSKLRNEKDRTPCHVATYASEVNVDVPALRMLIANGVDVHARDEDGATCLHFAAVRSGQAVTALLQAGADINAVELNGKTPLQYALDVAQCSELVWGSVTALLQHGADIHAADNDGRTVCHSATRYAMVPEPFLPTLMLLGADFDVPDNSGTTARMLLQGREPTEVEMNQARKFLVRLVRERAFQVCVGLQPLRINALQLCEILVHVCGPIAVAIPFHILWNIATTVKHHNHNSMNK